jgi:hypothetical protein
VNSIKRAMPSPAILVAVLALVAAVAGTAVAEQATTSAVTKKKVKKIAKKQANKQITRRAPGLSVAFAEEAGRANAANSANTADSADSLNELRFVRSASVDIAPDSVGSAVATCPTGFTATGGGGAYVADGTVQVVRSVPTNGIAGSAGFRAWEFRIVNSPGAPRPLRAYVVCARADNVTANYSPGAPVD